jgi:hypothetical protein
MSSIATFKRFFTPQEANGLLPEVLTALETARRLITEAREASVQLETATTDEVRSDAYCRLEEHRSSINQILNKLRYKGIEVKGFDPLLIDFPALRNGQEVYLCWLEGQAKVDSWHPVHTSIRHRQTVDPKRIGYWEWCN